MTATALKASKKASKEVQDLLPPETTITKSGAIEGLPYLRAREIASLQFIYEYLTRHRHYPTRGEIAKAVLSSDVSGPTSPYLDRLLRLGYLTRVSLTAHRNLRLTALGLKRLAQEGIAVNPKQLSFTQ